MAAAIVDSKYTATSTAALHCADATATPAPISADPAYRGWCVILYGPDLVTSLPFSRCPAAQKRSNSPAAAIALPAASVANVGCASHKTAAPNRNPSGTRLRASASSRRARRRVVRSAMQPLSHQIDDLARRNIEKAPALRVALTLVPAL